MLKILTAAEGFVKQDNVASSSNQTPEISFCVFADAEGMLLDLRNNCESFFAKYKIPWELSIVCSNERIKLNLVKSLPNSQGSAGKIIVSSSSKGSRAYKQWVSLLQSTAKYRALVEPQLDVPLAEILKLVQVLSEDSHLQVLFGNRFGVPKSFANRQIPKKMIREKTFADIRKEKKLTQLSDPFTSCLVMRDKVFAEAKEGNFPHWYIGPHFEDFCKENNIHYAEAPVFFTPGAADIPWSAKWQLFFANFF